MARSSNEQDGEGIREVLDAAFAPSGYESRLREIVVRDEVSHLEWVLEKEGGVVATILYTQATCGSEVIGYHLAPVAVHPRLQKMGLGSMLIRETLDLEPISEGSVFVLGDPDFYERFGFTQTACAICPFDQSNEHFRSLRWDDSREPFQIGYSDAFLKAE